MFGGLKEIWNKVKTLFCKIVWHKKFLFQVTMITLFMVLVAEVIVAILFIDDEITKKDYCLIWENQATKCSQITSFFFFKLFYVVVKYTSQATIILMIVTFIYLLIRWIMMINLTRDQALPQEKLPKENLEELDLPKMVVVEQKDLQTKALIEVLIGSLSASAIPTGLSLIICAFYNINLIQFMLGVEIYIAFAGISIISIAFLSTMRQDTEVEKAYDIVSPEDLLKPRQTDNKDDQV